MISLRRGNKKCLECFRRISLVSNVLFSFFSFILIKKVEVLLVAPPNVPREWEVLWRLSRKKTYQCIKTETPSERFDTKQNQSTRNAERLNYFEYFSWRSLKEIEGFTKDWRRRWILSERAGATSTGRCRRRAPTWCRGGSRSSSPGKTLDLSCPPVGSLSSAD